MGAASSAASAGEIWNFAYGSNMHPARRVSRAGLQPREVVPAILRGWRLCFNIPGVPLLEPAMASITRAPERCVHGVLLRLSAAEFRRLERSEGGTEFYGRVDVEVETYDGRRITARVFKTAAGRETRETPPSCRYLELLRTGARASGLDPQYCAELDALPHAPDSALRRACGAAFVDAYMWVSQGPARGLGNRYVRALQGLDRALPTGLRRVGQVGMLAPVVALGMLLRARGRPRDERPE